MVDIYSLQARAQELKGKTLTGSITPTEVGGLIEDVIEVISALEINLSSLGVVKIYDNVDSMMADLVSPMYGDKKIRFGQLVSIYNSANDNDPNNGNIYAYQVTQWRFVGNINKVAIGTAHGQAYSGVKGAQLEELIENETQKRETAIEELNETIETNRQVLESSIQFTDIAVEKNKKEQDAKIQSNEDRIIENSQEIDDIKERYIYQGVKEGIKPLETKIAKIERESFKSVVLSETQYEELRLKGQINDDVCYFITEGDD